MNSMQWGEETYDQAHVQEHRTVLLLPLYHRFD